MKSDVLIIGGGFYGAYIAQFFATQGKSVILCEKGSDLMTRASFANQARVHNGYHYPRSVLTAMRSRVSFPRFSDEFSECIDDSFEKYYLIGKALSKITALQFKNFCERIGAPYEMAENGISKLFNEKFVESAFKVREYAFDSVKLKSIMFGRLLDLRVDIRLNTEVTSVRKSGSELIVSLNTGENEKLIINAKQVFNCTYSMINSINKGSNLELLPLKHELAEMCLVDVPEEIKNKSFTLMCGPFFSIMPFPSTDHYTFTHVRYTPHYGWVDKHYGKYINAEKQLYLTPHKSNWKKIQKDAIKYMPILSECKYVSSIWEVKTTLLSSENSDSRPILFKRDHGLDGYHCVMGGKIDNVYDVIETISTREVSEENGGF